MNTKNTPTAPEIYKLIVLQGPDRGKEFVLEPGLGYVAGRAEDCHIRLDASDKTVSRQHARMTAAAGKIQIESLSAANPVQVNGKPVQAAALKSKDQFRIGETLFMFEKTGGKGPVGPGAKKILIFSGLGFVCLLFVMIIFVGGDEKTPAPETGTIPSEVTKTPSLSPSAGTASSTPGPDLPTSGIMVSPEDMKAADQHFRQGMFFYDTGNLSRAVEEWNRAVVLCPDHPEARSWFLRTEKELEDQVKTHYQNAMMHYKYMRYKDAAQEFRIVVALSRNKTGDQYLNALKTLNELEGR
jgi:pSer/pThr/pTyr-binding forkhead associated (FHA) protein